MANEITVNTTLRCVNGNLSFLVQTGNLQFDQTAVGGPTPGFQDVGTTEETLTTTEISTLGWAFFKNLDETNYVEVGFSTGVYGIRLEAGEIATFRVNPGSTIYMKANTASCKVQAYVLED